MRPRPQYKAPRQGTPVTIDGQSCILVPLTYGLHAIIDASDGPIILAHNWHAQKSLNTYYAAARIYANGNPKGRKVFMHRIILGNIKQVDHINRNGWDNRKSNLRPCNHSQNVANGRCKRPLRGVHLARKNKFRAVIGVRGQYKHIGTFETAEAAALAYDAAAIAAFGEFASLNFPAKATTTAQPQLV